jgi:hypothetical protein
VITRPPGKPELAENDPEKISQLLELQLTQQRAAWKQASARYRLFRSLSFFFLFLVIAGGLFVFFVISSRFNEERTNHPEARNAIISHR